MSRAIRTTTILAIVTGLAASGAFAQSSSNPFSGLFKGRGPNIPQEIPGPPVDLQFQVIDGPDDLERRVRTASLLTSAVREGRTTGQEVLAAARADYARILGVLYDEGYFSTIINIRLDGVEAVEIAPLDSPDIVQQVVVTFDPGPRFRFSRADIGPLAPDTELPEGYAVGEPGGTTVIKSAARTAIGSWRDYGHAKAAATGQEIIADHDTSELESSVTLDPGPPVTFGTMHMQGYERMKTYRLRKIAGFPEGERFDPEKLEDVRKRLRRTGVFSAITLTEAETLNPDNSMDVDLTVVEQKLRRIGAGAEVSTTDGAAISAYWIHRNLLGGAERLRVEGAVTDIGNNGTDGLDYELGVRIERPATPHPDVTAYLSFGVDIEDEDDYKQELAYAGLGFTYILREEIVADVALQYRTSKVTDDTGINKFRSLALPMSVTWDKRDDQQDAKKGFRLAAEVTPFLGFGDTGSGTRLWAEGRHYRSFGADDRMTLAGRASAGTVVGTDIEETPREYLFWSGGGGSVRGHSFESLGSYAITGEDGEPVHTGGMSIVNLSGEVRYRVRDKIGLVGFVDAGQVWDEDIWSGNTGWQLGAGVGVRYSTPVGPIRLDVATPIGGGDADSGGNVQLYLGLGQSF